VSSDIRMMKISNREGKSTALANVMRIGFSGKLAFDNLKDGNEPTTWIERIVI
jgi:hypothetical protein